LGAQRVAPGKKNTSRLKASLVFLDESGLLMAPLVRRTWAPVGQTPILYQRTRSHERVSMIAAITVSPKRRKVGLYFRLLPKENVVTGNLLSFLRQLQRQLGNPILIVWDRLNVHRSIWAKIHPRNRSIHSAFLPPYAPELNPVEAFWAYLKMNPLANYAVRDVEELRRRADRHTRHIADDQLLLRSFIKASPLSLRLK
jgi:transposase